MTVSWVFGLTLALAIGSSHQAIRECRTSVEGGEYRGLVNVTVSGWVCQSWASQSPHGHAHTDPKRFPDGDFGEAANHCRNPDLEPGGPWCFTVDPRTRWEYCSVPRCSDYPECKISQKGEEYRGHVSTTVTGKTCRMWNDASKKKSVDSGDENYCRANPHPSENPAAPWCYVQGGSAEDWELCDIPWCKPSAICRAESSGARYAGTVSITKSGRPCQRWDKQAPHAHSQNPNNFPERSLADAENYCRNPDGEPGPWCYTEDPDVRWELCDVPLCTDCKVSETGREYAGTLATTAQGATCLSWLDAAISDPGVSDPNNYPDAALPDAANYCRNPDGKSGGPWCYTSSSGDWGYCDLQLCQGSACPEDTEGPLPRRVRHVIHIGVDGLHPGCFTDAPGGAPNIVQRLGAEGSWTRTLGRTALESVSAPGWSNVIAGMPVETTGIFSNSYRPLHMGFEWPITPAYGPNIPTPTVFSTLKAYDQNIRTAAYYDWHWWRYLTSYGVPGSVDNDNFCDPSKTKDDYQGCDAINTEKSTKYISQVLQSASASYTFVYIGLVDETGHAHGWCQDRYLKAVEWMDESVGEILDAVERDRTDPYNDVLVILNSDHGGSGTCHGKKQDSDLQVPLYLRGGSIKKNFQFTKEVRNQDVVPTAVHLMGFSPNPWWKGNVIGEAILDN